MSFDKLEKHKNTFISLLKKVQFGDKRNIWNIIGSKNKIPKIFLLRFYKMNWIKIIQIQIDEGVEKSDLFKIQKFS